MKIILLTAVIFSLFLLLFVFIWIKVDRRYTSVKSVASAYDSWTKDQLLETLWGEHIHLGYYGFSQQNRNFRQAKVDFVHELVNWSGLDRLPPGSRVIDVGCGIGGSARILAKEYGFDVVAISISPVQISRAIELTDQGIKCDFQVMDALDLKFSDATFDAVWSVEVGPHILDKQLYADELLRVLRPGGILAVADWNRRDVSNGETSLVERLVMRQLLDQWAHPEFSSIPMFRNNLENSKYKKGLIQTADWTNETCPSWSESIFEGFRRSRAVFALGPEALLKGIREIPTILLMRWAFSTGLMRFGVFRTGDE
ncbi:methyltransferase domain-containing protein [Prochlorococcus sp. MIT 1341]|uniref:methyltransferase domain-containing protein n=1 Tax=Prochlorococcus sp. MIT 1341 TaxID=3096221 RepID=UPI002A7494FD|nr:methyltransferase domain-containing protein [Prochlorococcus sp. MIT 1341]